MKTKLSLIALTIALALPIVVLAQRPIKMAHFIKTVASTGTPEAISSTNLLVSTVTVLGVKAERTANVGTVYIGWSSGNDTQFFPVLTSGEVVIGTTESGRKFNLKDIYVDVLNNGDGVGVYYQ